MSCLLKNLAPCYPSIHPLLNLTSSLRAGIFLLVQDGILRPSNRFLQVGCSCAAQAPDLSARPSVSAHGHHIEPRCPAQCFCTCVLWVKVSAQPFLTRNSVWSAGCKASGCSILWASERLHTKEKEKKNSVYREESRWRTRRTWNSPLLTSTSRIHIQMEHFSQSTCWTLAEDLGHLKGQEKSPHNQVGWKKEKKKRGNDKGPAALVGSWRWGEVPALRKAGKSAGSEKDLWEIRGECSN